jgi:hypothetical protein
VEDLVNFLTTMHTGKTANLNKEEKKQSPEAVTSKKNENSKQATQTWDQTERRQHKDRRKIKVNRGRWLDSRQQTDRRKSLVFYTQI